VNPFDFLPRAGQSIEIPGGVMWCDRWEVRQGYHQVYDGPECIATVLTGNFTGEITFRFFTSDSSALDPKRIQVSVPELGDAPQRPLLEGGAS
jgi:hypothetical protein